MEDGTRNNARRYGITYGKLQVLIDRGTSWSMTCERSDEGLTNCSAFSAVHLSTFIAACTNVQYMNELLVILDIQTSIIFDDCR